MLLKTLPKKLDFSILRRENQLMGRHRSSDRPYKFRACSGRPISVEFDFMPGKRISTGCYDMPGATLFAEDYLRHEGIALHFEKKIPTLNEFAKDFFMKEGPNTIRDVDRLYKRNRAPKYYEKKQSILDNHILPKFGNIMITAITAKSIEAWIPTIHCINGNEAADNTKNKILDTFRIVLDAAKKDGYITENPARDVQKITAESIEREAVPPEQTAILFPEDPEERIKIWHGIMWAVYFSIAYDTGWRHGEIAALRVSDVWVTQKGYYVTANRTFNHEANQILERVKTSGKGLEKRSGLLYDDTAELLLKYIDERKLSGDDLLFSGPNSGKPLVSETTNKHFKMVMREHGFFHEGIVQYCLRHSYETDRRGDMPDSILAVSMGHTKLRNDYDHRGEKEMIRLLDRNRDSFFENRKRRGQEPGVIPLDEALKEGKA